ncbi:MAG: BsaA family SipW-dependent biofilm matrix protein [Ruminococcus sp.]|nr:BsaA family SipW-dependent biofilm matrix protein [Ruminococcus sp.]
MTSTTTTQNKKKNAKQKRALVASVILAALIAIGGTFAWFTSEDTVVNELSASSSYGVSITEDFTPPEQWTPGQTITKEVAAVNTGNVAAFVKVELTDTLSLTYESTSTDIPSANGSDTYVTLTSDEVTSLQAGGQLVYAAGETITDNTVSSEDYTPSTTGLYVFERSDGTYVGYYYDADDNIYYKVSSISESEGTYTASYAVEKTVDNATITFSSTILGNASTGWYITATYAGTDTSSTADDIVINIYLDDDYKDNWTAVYDTDTWTFYYNHVLGAGETSELLVKAMELDDDVTAEAYTSFTYDLNVALASAQAVTENVGENGVGEVSTEAVNALGWGYEASIDDNNKVYVNEEGIIVKDADDETKVANTTTTVTWSDPSASGNGD